MCQRKYDVIQVVLAKHGITRYRLAETCGEGWILPGSSGGEVEAESGTVVTPDRAYRFWLGWANGDYTLGEEDGSWYELTPENESESSWQEILHIQQQMRDDPTFGAREPLVLPAREPDQPTEREKAIIVEWLWPRFFDDYDTTEYDGPFFEVLDVQSGGHDLVGSLLPGEVQGHFRHRGSSSGSISFPSLLDMGTRKRPVSSQSGPLFVRRRRWLVATSLARRMHRGAMAAAGNASEESRGSLLQTATRRSSYAE